jgi:hypothetical protein
MTDILIAAVGLVIVLMSIRALARTVRRSTFRVGRGRLLRRRYHPVTFWANAAGIGVICAIGLALIGWALLRLE